MQYRYKYESYPNFRRPTSLAAITIFPLYIYLLIFYTPMTTGNLTVEIAKKYAPRLILGLDIDEDLISKACARIRNLHFIAKRLSWYCIGNGQLKDSKKGMDYFQKMLNSNVVILCMVITTITISMILSPV